MLYSIIIVIGEVVLARFAYVQNNQSEGNNKTAAVRIADTTITATSVVIVDVKDYGLSKMCCGVITGHTHTHTHTWEEGGRVRKYTTTERTGWSGSAKDEG